MIKEFGLPQGATVDIESEDYEIALVDRTGLAIPEIEANKIWYSYDGNQKNVHLVPGREKISDGVKSELRAFRNLAVYILTQIKKALDPEITRYRRPFQINPEKVKDEDCDREFHFYFGVNKGNYQYLVSSLRNSRLRVSCHYGV